MLSVAKHLFFSNVGCQKKTEDGRQETEDGMSETQSLTSSFQQRKEEKKAGKPGLFIG